MFSTIEEVHDYAAELRRGGLTEAQVLKLMRSKVETALAEERWAEVSLLVAAFPSLDSK